MVITKSFSFKILVAIGKSMPRATTVNTVLVEENLEYQRLKASPSPHRKLCWMYDILMLLAPFEAKVYIPKRRTRMQMKCLDPSGLHLNRTEKLLLRCLKEKTFKNVMAGLSAPSVCA